MKPLVARYIPFALLTTLIYTSLVLLKVTPGPSWLNKHMRHVSQSFHDHLGHRKTLHSANNSTVSYASPSHLAWLNALIESASLVGRKVSQLNLGSVNEMFVSKPRGTTIGGTWTEYLGQLNGTGLALPTTIVFAPTLEAPRIPPSPNNGYLNSRIDLRRRKRAFDSQTVDKVGSPFISLYLREDAIIQPRNITESTLVTELQRAVKRNQKLEQDLAARKARKARKKKKVASAKKSA
ncbi:hypothetical protein BDV93DRAFT_601596 [Ceratobasidium sp. AG-I]|nr:hypothetical protein BDV93DRAFT_601596 [Ceratobasidium sp. AG-I]